MEFINEEVLVGILLALLGTKAAAMAIVNTTDTPKDDNIAGKVYKVVEVIAGIVAPERAKQFAGELDKVKEDK